MRIFGHIYPVLLFFLFVVFCFCPQGVAFNHIVFLWGVNTTSHTRKTATEEIEKEEKNPLHVLFILYILFFHIFMRGANTSGGHDTTPHDLLQPGYTSA